MRIRPEKLQRGLEHLRRELRGETPPEVIEAVADKLLDVIGVSYSYICPICGVAFPFEHRHLCEYTE